MKAGLGDNQTKIRVIVHDPRVLDVFEKAIALMVKTWGKRRLIQKRIIERDPEKNIYSNTFGKASHVGYYKITVDPAVFQ